MAKLRKLSAFDDLSSKDDEDQAMPVLGAAYDLGIARNQAPQQQAQRPEPVSDSRATRSQSSAQTGAISDLRMMEAMDPDRINSLDNSLSAAARFKGFSRYRAKYGGLYGGVAMIGSGR